VIVGISTSTIQLGLRTGVGLRSCRIGNRSGHAKDSKRYLASGYPRLFSASFSQNKLEPAPPASPGTSCAMRAVPSLRPHTLDSHATATADIRICRTAAIPDRAGRRVPKTQPRAKLGVAGGMVFDWRFVEPEGTPGEQRQPPRSVCDGLFETRGPHGRTTDNGVKPVLNRYETCAGWFEIDKIYKSYRLPPA
jgi:hypothetical protein